jgi:Caspase domain
MPPVSDTLRRSSGYLRAFIRRLYMDKRALLVGVDSYDHMSPLTGCVADARAMSQLLERHENGDRNYECRVLTSPGGPPVTRQYLRAKWQELFDSFDGHILFYFSGHGTLTKAGGVIVTQEGTHGDPGLSMDELVALASRSKAKTLLLILDCCYSGGTGDPSLLQVSNGSQGQTVLREGMTILAASRPTEVAREMDGQGVFTRLLLGALSGGAADVRGQVSAASIYAYVEQALGSWDQRPMYKSYADRLPPVRLCKPSVPDPLLRELPKLFEAETSSRYLAPSYEVTHPTAKPSHVALFKKFKTLRNSRLLTTQSGKDLFFIALERGWVKLTPLGQLYWNLAAKGLV